jgi:hypothetical protein
VVVFPRVGRGVQRVGGFLVVGDLWGLVLVGDDEVGSHEKGWGCDFSLLVSGMSTHGEGFGSAAFQREGDGAGFCGGLLEETGCVLGFRVVGCVGLIVRGGGVAVEELVHEGAAAGLA